MTRSESRAQEDASRNRRIIAAVACPLCRVPVGVPCRAPTPWLNEGPDTRQQPMFPHAQRRRRWLSWKQKNGII